MIGNRPDSGKRGVLHTLVAYFPEGREADFEKSWQTSIALGVMFSTAMAFVSSLVFAAQVLNLGRYSILLALSWSAAIFFVDLLIIRQPPESFGSGFGLGTVVRSGLMLLSRVLLAATVAFLVAEPMVQIFFKDAINNQLILDNSVRLDRVSVDIYQDLLSNKVENLSNVQLRQVDVWDQVKVVKTRRAEFEEEAKRGSAASNFQAGRGPVWEGAKNNLDDANSTLSDLVDECRESRNSAMQANAKLEEEALTKVNDEKSRLENPAYVVRQVSLARLMVSDKDSALTSTSTQLRILRDKSASIEKAFPSCSESLPTAGESRSREASDQGVAYKGLLADLREFQPAQDTTQSEWHKLRSDEARVVRERYWAALGALFLIDITPITMKYLVSATPFRYRLAEFHQGSISNLRIQSIRRAATTKRWKRSIRKQAVDLRHIERIYRYRLARVSAWRELVRAAFLGGRKRVDRSRVASSRAHDVPLDPQLDLAVGLQVGNWMLIERLDLKPSSETSFWKVSHIAAEQTDPPHVMKVFTPSDLGEVDAARVLIEAAPHKRHAIAPVSDAFVFENGLAFIVTQYFPQGTVKSFFEKKTTRSLRYGLEILDDVLMGLSSAAKLSVYHGDVKPANVVVKVSTSSCESYLIDWGLARVDTSPSDHRSLATPFFGAPEVWRKGGKVDNGLADLYGAAATFYWYFTGIPPYWQHYVKVYEDRTPTASKMTEFFSRRDLELVRLGEILEGVDIPESLDEMLMRWLSLEPERRLPTLEGRGIRPSALAARVARMEFRGILKSLDLNPARSDSGNLQVGPDYVRSAYRESVR